MSRVVPNLQKLKGRLEHNCDRVKTLGIMGVVVLIVVMMTEMLPTDGMFTADCLLERQVTK